MSDPLSRRAMLRLTAAGGLAALVGCRGGGSADEARVCGAIGDAGPGVLAMGVRYRELHPDDDFALAADGLPDDPDLALRRLSDRVRQDFAAGEVVDVDGWVLARTEARAAALLSVC